MKTFIVTLIATSFLAALVVPENAYARREKPRKKYINYDKQAAKNDASDYYQHDVNKVPFGSTRWWREVERTFGGGSGDGSGGGTGGQ
jgi:hypothetical protein